MDGNRFWYIAAPFFNPAQLATVQSIENLMGQFGEACFSPRRDAGNPPGGPKTKEDASKIFRNDIMGLMRATHVLAWIDWKLLDGFQVQLVDLKTCLPPDGGAPNTVAVLNVPDSGTVFEMGGTYMRNFIGDAARGMFPGDPVAAMGRIIEALEKLDGRIDPEIPRSALDLMNWASVIKSAVRPSKLVVFTERPKESGVNLMLTQGASGVVYGLEELERYLTVTYETGEEPQLSEWKGGFR